MDYRRRNLSYKKYWKTLLDYYGQLCFYCKEEIATTIDHVIPYSHDQDNSIENLVPACQLCNCIAGNKHFNNAEQKRNYILKRRKGKRMRRAICPTCLLPFEYRYHSPSFIMCAECYDDEYDTSYAFSRKWRNWLDVLFDAGIAPEAHKRIRYSTDHQGIRGKQLALIVEYEKEVENNPDFCPWISFTDATAIQDEVVTYAV